MKVLIQPYTQVLSHTIRALLVAKELRSRGHTVVFGAGSAKTTFINNEGFNILPMYEPDSEIIWDNIRNGKMKFVAKEELDHMIEDDLRLYNEVRPDLVLSDFRFTAQISTHLAGIRHAAIVNASSTEYRSLPFIPLFEWLPNWLIKRDTIIWELIDILNLKLEITVFDNVMNYFKQLSKKYRLNKTVTATNCLVGKDITLLADIPEYFPTKNLPNNYYYIGPLTWKNDIPVPTWWPPAHNGNPLIYITMGTTGIGDFFNSTFDLSMKSDFVVIMTTGGHAPNINTIKNKVYIEDYIDGDLVMDASDLVVCHGGNGTIYQALQHGKPIIGIPNTPDGTFNMRRVEALGVGKMITWKEFNNDPTILTEMIRRITKEPNYKIRASNLKNKLENYMAATTAANILERGGQT